MRGCIPAAVVVCVLLLLACGCSSPRGSATVPVTADRTDHPVTSEIPAGRGHYLFTDTLGNADRPITVYTYRPAAWNTSGPVLIVMPGAGRDGSGPREIWIPYAEKYGSLVVVPEFSLRYYPDDMWYISGHTFDPKGWQPKKNWTYMAIEHLFDDIRQKSGAARNTYLLDGHSAGAQFVHRLVLVRPEARYSRAVAANAGMYLMPNLSVPYGYGLKDGPVPPAELPGVLSRKLIILSGGADTNPDDGGLPKFPEAAAQGPNRLERAKLFYASARALAAGLDVPLTWEYHVVPGVGHDEAGMAGPSAEYLFTGTQAG